MIKILDVKGSGLLNVIFLCYYESLLLIFIELCLTPAIHLDFSNKDSNPSHKIQLEVQLKGPLNLGMCPYRTPVLL